MRSKLAINARWKKNEKAIHFDNFSSDVETVCRRLRVEAGESSVINYPSSEDGRVTMPSLSMPACLISAMVFMTTP